MAVFVCVEAHSYILPLSAYHAPARPRDGHSAAYSYLYTGPGGESILVIPGKHERVGFHCTRRDTSE